MPSRSIEDLHPTLKNVWGAASQKWEEIYPDLPSVFLTCTYRSNEEQNELYAQGRTKKGKIVTRAKAGQSPHNYKPSFAFDIAFQSADKKLDWRPFLFDRFAKIVTGISNEVLWGGDFKSFKDKPHFELKNWKQL